MTNQEFKNKLDQILKSNFVYDKARRNIIDQILELLKTISGKQIERTEIEQEIKK